MVNDVRPPHAQVWGPGDPIVMRSVWDGKIVAAWPVTIVSHTPDQLVIYLAAGTRYMVRLFDSDPGARLPIGEWSLVEAQWRVDLIRIMRRDDDHSHLAFWTEDGVFSRWYVNLERSFERTPIGIDFVDHFLDIVIQPDLESWRWKDEDELDQAVAAGVITAQRAHAIRVQAAKALSRLETKSSPFGDGWERWSRDPAWAVPSLPPNWRVFG